jgi:type IV secretion system protein VirB10
MGDDSRDLPEEQVEEEPRYETPESVTSFPKWFDRKKTMMTIAGIFVAIVLFALISGGGGSKKKQAASESAWAANVPKDFLQRELERSLINSAPAVQGESEAVDSSAVPETADQYGLPAVTVVPYTPSPPQPPPPQQSNERRSQPQLSSLIPRVEGSLFSSQAAFETPSPQTVDPYAGLPLSGFDPSALAGLASGLGQLDPYAAQNDQAGKNNFYNAASNGAVTGGYLQSNLLWIGTIIPAVLETAINTDLPGNVIARVTQNIYDSHTGQDILIPQGTILIAQYNRSVSYSQRRVQVVWDVLIRPDGYQVELEGMNGVDPKGAAGLKAKYRENWFEYIKAAGIVSLFSVINSKLVEEVAKYGSDEMAAGVITSNAEFIKDLGGNLISRALNIQPTLTVDNGEKINVMLNKNIYLPPCRNFEVKQRYVLP